jgi:hypothetical protein
MRIMALVLASALAVCFMDPLQPLLGVRPQDHP